MTPRQTKPSAGDEQERSARVESILEQWTNPGDASDMVSLLIAELDRVTADRDEARRMLQFARDGMSQLEGWRDAALAERDDARERTRHISELMAERDVATARAEKAEVERDDAIEMFTGESKDARSLAEDLIAAVACARRAEKERAEWVERSKAVCGMAAFETNALRAQVEQLRKEMGRAEFWLMERHPDHQQEGLGIIQAALAATTPDAEVKP